MTPLSDRLSRLPLRVRLVAGFSVAMFVVLVSAGAFVYWRVQYALDRGLDSELSQATQVIDPLVLPNGVVTNRESAEATGVAWQVLDADGTVLDHGGAASVRSMLSARRLARIDDAQTIDLGDFLPESEAPYRLHVVRTTSDPAHFLMTGIRRDHRDEALRELLAQLVLAGLIALLITALVGDRLAHAALQPVERYRRRAAEIAAGSVDLRLDVPPRRDDEVTRLGHTFNDMLATLERALDRERQFVDEASHELRTPITLLSGRIQLARRRPRTVEEHERILAELQIDLDRLAALANQLLELGAAATGEHGGTSDLAVVVTHVVEQRVLAGTSDGLHADLRSNSAPVAIPAVAVERIVTNLLDNAHAHGEPPVVVGVDRPTPEWSRLVVTDSGTGMSPDLLTHATQRFARSEDARARPGAGLGLALVEALVTRSGGELRLCYGGHHTSHGRSVPVVCTHGHEMSVTVLLPAGTPT